MSASPATEVQEKRIGILRSIFAGGLRRTLLLWFLVLSMVPVVVVSLFSYRDARQSLYENVEKSLTSLLETKTEYIQFYFERMMTDLTQEAEEISNLQFLVELHSAFVESGVPIEEFVKSFKWALVTDERSGDLRSFQRTYGYHDVFLIDSEGNVLFSVMGEEDMGTNLFIGPYSDTRFADACKRTLENGNQTFSDYELYAPSGNAAAGFLVSVILNDEGEKIGLIAIQILVDQINAIMQQRIGLGETGETYLVGPDLRMRSDSPLVRQDTVLQEALDTEQTRAWHEAHVKEGRIECDRNPFIYDGPHGERVIGIHANLVIKGVPYGLIAEIEESVAFAATHRLQDIAISLLLVTSVVVLLIAVFVAGRIVKPVRHLSAVANRVAVGNLDVNVLYEGRGDELGTLARSFSEMGLSLRGQAELARQIAEGNLAVEVSPRSEEDVLGNALSDMVESLRRQIREIGEGANVLVASSGEIATLSAQLASASSESSTAVAQTTTTVEEVRQASQAANGKSSQISADFQKTASASQTGAQSTEEAAKQMSLIREQMEAIAESIVRLSEQSQAVGEIISSVDDIAEQSNLLAVNAAVEAARAGEQGKGFAVVAAEIKNLAEQSKRATTQVRGILNDIQKATNTAVMVTEQGGKVVDVGAEQMSKSGEVIRTLTDSVSESSQAASQIAAASQQQLVGMEQITLAMGSINQTSEQNLASTKQLEEGARSLSDLGKKLQELVGRYKV